MVCVHVSFSVSDLPHLINRPTRSSNSKVTDYLPEWVATHPEVHLKKDSWKTIGSAKKTILSGLSIDNRVINNSVHFVVRQTPNRRNRDQAKDDDCFFSTQDEDIHEDFDFEKNLALFDKRLVLQEIQDDVMSNQPDLVRLVDCNKRKTEPKYRNDENVLESLPAVFR